MSSGSAWSLDFDSTGTKMYAIHSNSGTVYQYTLSSAFDVSTASYASKSFDTSSQTSDPTSIAITSDGTSLYVVSSASDQVFKYTLSTAFDLATASYSGISLTTTSQDNFPMGVAVKTDETKLYVTGTQNDSVYQYSLADSLTPAQTYFVQTDGTLSQTADDPSVIAGTAVAGSTLIVKG
jgi:DNA-binding beta-propeller fold protein YncE